MKIGSVTFRLTAGFALSVLSPFAGGAPVAAQQAQYEPTLEEARTAATRFADVSAAVAAGYVPDPTGMCITAELEGRAPDEGAMGLHYFRPDLLGLVPGGERVNGTGTHTDFRDPAVLLYEPQADGSLVLVGVENLVFQKAWREAGHTEPPTFHGRSFDPMMDDPNTPLDEAHGFEPHFDQHVWLFRENPRGDLTPFNPAVTCAHAARAASTGS